MRYLMKLHDEGQDWYLEWDTEMDAPATQGMTLEDFKEYYSNRYGPHRLLSIGERLSRVEQFGVSTDSHTLDAAWSDA
jgi:hypothetical protein